MRATLKELMDKLGVGYILSAYETCPWAAYDDEKGVSCNAEVRMNNEANEIEAEIQFMRDEPQPDEKPVEQIFWLLAKPIAGENWEVKIAKINGDDGSNSELYDYAGKAVNFFAACVLQLKMNKVPDIEEILAREMKSTERFGGNSQGGGGKSPKIKPQAVLGIKGGRGF